MKKTILAALVLLMAGRAFADDSQAIPRAAVPRNAQIGALTLGTITAVDFANGFSTLFSINGGPCSSGACSFSVDPQSQTANTFLAGPTSGGAAAATMRAMVAADMSAIGILLQASSPGTLQTGNIGLEGIGVFQRANVLNVATQGLLITNSTTTSGGATVQYSPYLEFRGNAWNSSGGANETQQWRLINTPATVAGTTTSTFLIQSSVNGGAFGTGLSIFSNAAGVGGVIRLGATSGADLCQGTTGGCLLTATDGWILSNAAKSSDGKLYWGATGATGIMLDRTSTSPPTLSMSAGDSSTCPSFEFVANNGAGWNNGCLSESLTLSTGGLTTDTTANLLPANALIDAVVVRITTTITTTTNWAVGDPTSSARFCDANATKTSGTTSVCLNHFDGAKATTLALSPPQAAAAKVRITCTGSNPGAGVIRITVFYRVFTPPTS